MREWTYRNHFRFGYNGKWFNLRQSLEDTFQVAYGRCDREPETFGAECIRAARLIAENTRLPIQIFYSGGADSEAVVHAFLAANVPFQTVIIRFKAGLNSHDIAFADKFCREHQIVPRYLDLDVIRFFESGLAFDYAEQTQAVSPQFLHHMWGMDQIDGYPILGSGECYIRKQELENSNGLWAMHEKEKVAAWYRYFMVRNREGAPGFFQYTPELMLSWLREPLVVDLINNRIPGKQSSISSKLLIYRKYFEMQQTPTFGYTGFEQLVEIDKRVRPQLRQKYGEAEVRVNYSDLLRMLEPTQLAERKHVSEIFS